MLSVGKWKYAMERRWSTHRYKYAVRVFRFLILIAAHDVSKTFNVIHTNNVDVVVEAEGLNECEVDLQSDVTFVLLIRSQDTESHAVWVTEVAQRRNID